MLDDEKGSERFARTGGFDGPSRFRTVVVNLQGMTPIFESFTDGEHFLIVDVVVAFGFIDCER